MKIVIGLFVAAILGLVGWVVFKAATVPTHGPVVQHSYSDGYWYSCGGNPKVPQMCYQPPQWCITIRDDNDMDHEGDRCEEAPAIQDRYPVGSHYPEGVR